ncbi:calcium-binding protein, partial [Novosphingobium sp.]|uniref:beta strand repeat-containing protein n=1 Tax=Novosphingobium sp. TaxID=1874826 RepID=UPI0025F86AC7
MPFIFPTLPTRPATPTHSATTEFTGAGPITIAATDIYYTRNLDTVDGSTPPGPHFIPPFGSPTAWFAGDPNPPYTVVVNNAGIIWNWSDRYSAQATAGGGINNTGWIIAEAFPRADNLFGAGQQSSAYGAYAYTSLNNAGTIVADAQGNAYAADTQQAYVTVVNSGTIAARSSYLADHSVSGGAYALRLLNGGNATNTATGVIYAEGPQATAVVFGRGAPPAFPEQGVLTNHGLIEAVSTDPARDAIGVRVQNIRGESFLLVNDGTIRADIAIYAPSDAEEIFTTANQQNAQTIQNLAGGLIEGEIRLNRGNDVLTNAGSIVGRIDMGEGNDTIDSSAGSIVGLVDLAMGQDSFTGGTGNETVRGGLGNDLLYGGGGADLLIGDGNDDTLRGDGGNDGLYGGAGNDLLITEGGDLADGGSGNDSISTADYAFARIAGGTGHDLWSLQGGTRAIDLGAALAGGRLSGIDEIALSTGKQLTIHAGNVTALSDAAELVISQASGSTVYLDGGWTAGATSQIGTQTYRAYTLGAERVLVDTAATVVLGLPASAGGGLDAVAAGPAAALPDAAAGTGLSDTVANGLRSVMDSLTIDAQTTVSRTDGGFVLFFLDTTVNPVLTNYGTIVGDNSQHVATSVSGVGSLVPMNLQNYGTIRASGVADEDATAVLQGSAGLLHNSGLIEASTERGDALGAYLFGSYFASDYSNTGSIHAVSQHGFATGAFFYNYTTFTNDGNIIAEGGDGAAAVDLSFFGGSLTNNGTITATVGPKATYYGLGAGVRDGQLTNTGLIAADIAVYLVSDRFASTIVNSGQINGTVILDYDHNSVDFFGATIVNQAGGTINGSLLLGSGRSLGSSITNRGTINGDVEFYVGNDTLDAVGGTINGAIFGGAGNDLYKVDTQSLLIVENADEGVDTVEATTGYYLFANIENLVLTGTAGNFGVGNDLANTITGNSGSNLLLGGLGDDVLNGGDGVDSLFGQDGVDTLNGDAGVDYLVGGIGNDVLHGGADADALYGEDGDDTLDGGDSFDTDILVGGAGNDTLDGVSGQANP